MTAENSRAELENVDLPMQWVDCSKSLHTSNPFIEFFHVSNILEKGRNCFRAAIEYLRHFSDLNFAQQELAIIHSSSTFFIFKARTSLTEFLEPPSYCTITISPNLNSPRGRRLQALKRKGYWYYIYYQKSFFYGSWVQKKILSIPIKTHKGQKHNKYYLLLLANLKWKN